MYAASTGTMASVSDASIEFQSLINWPMNCCAPNVTVFVASPGARISGNHRSFQIGIMVKTATVATAGRTSGRTSQKIRYSLIPSIRAASFRSRGTWRMNCCRMKTASGRPWAA